MAHGHAAHSIRDRASERSSQPATLSVGLADDLVRKSLARQVAETLQQRIVEGKIPPGTRLRAETIASAFSVSRSPVREALADLESKGLTEQLPNRDRRVAVPTEKFISDTFEVLVVLESARFHAASLVATPATIQRAMDLLNRMDALGAADDRIGQTQTSREFHRLLMDGCQNVQLSRVTEDWYLYVTWFRNLYSDHHNETPEAAAQHYRIVECFSRRDRQGLMDALRVHIEAHRDSILRSWRTSESALLAGTNRTLDLVLDDPVR
jgi:DNA-binding GntR family transcriptional regulator